MSDFRTLSHLIDQCTYHFVCKLKYRFRIAEGLVKEILTKDVHVLMEWKSYELIDLSFQIGHTHLIVSAPPKLSVSQLMGILKEINALKIFRSYPLLDKKPH
ncbi:MAG: IS200/IS605 family transposase [Bacteroidales bacterium]|nr:IS200/IS605 family transposase [Bacteroidales bacterium]